MGEKVQGYIGCLLYGGFSVLSLAGWLQHLYTCFNEHLYGFLIAGAIFFPNCHYSWLGNLARILALTFKAAATSA